MNFNTLNKWAPYIALIAFLLTPSAAFAAGTLDYNFGDLSQEVYSNTANGISLSGCDAVNYYFGVQSADGTIGGGWVHSNCTTNNQFRSSDFSMGFKDTDYGTWHIFLCSEADGAACVSPAFTYDYCNTVAGLNDCGGGGGGSGGFEAMLAASESGAASTTGFSIGALTRYSGDNLAAVFIGSGLGALLALRYWIAAIMIISVIIFFTRRGFQFFKH